MQSRIAITCSKWISIKWSTSSNCCVTIKTTGWKNEEEKNSWNQFSKIDFTIFLFFIFSVGGFTEIMQFTFIYCHCIIFRKTTKRKYEKEKFVKSIFSSKRLIILYTRTLTILNSFNTSKSWKCLKMVTFRLRDPGNESWIVKIFAYICSITSTFVANNRFCKIISRFLFGGFNWKYWFHEKVLIFHIFCWWFYGNHAILVYVKQLYNNAPAVRTIFT